MITLDILTISTYNEGTFTARVHEDGQEVICRLYHKERDWDKLYDYLTRPMKVKVNLMTAGNLLVMEIIEQG